MIVSKANSYLYINLNPSAMKQASLPLTLQDARNIVDGHYELTVLVARLYLFGEGPYQGRTSAAMVVRFLEMAPYKGDALYRLYQDSGKPFSEFVSDVNNGEYFWNAVGKSLALLFEIPFHMTRIMTRRVLTSMENPFKELASINSE